MSNNIRAIILAAGQGKRLLPLTKKIPKALIKLNKISFLDYQINKLQKYKIPILVVVGFQSEKVRSYLAQRYPEVKTVVNNFINTDNAYSLRLSDRYLEGKALIIDGDLLFPESILERVIKSKHENLFVIDSKKKPNSEDAKVELFKERAVKIGKFVKKKGAIYVSLVKLSGKVLNLLKKELSLPKYRKSYYSVPLNEIIKKYSVPTIEIKDEWIEVDNRTDLKIARKLYKKWQKR